MMETQQKVLSYISVLTMILHSSAGGSCWRNFHTGGCSDLLENGVNRTECCRLGTEDSPTYYSEMELNSRNAVQFMLRVYYRAIQCSPCSDGCVDHGLNCRKDESCVATSGTPRCVCSIDCRPDLAHLSGPVCGTDGQSYRSHCHLLRSNCKMRRDVEIAYLGSCKDSGCDGVVCLHPNKICVTDQYNLPVCIRGNILCPLSLDTHEQVCGTDNRTYGSSCILARHAIHLQKTINIQHHGPCGAGSCESDSQCQVCLHDHTGGSSVCQKTSCRECSSSENNIPVCGSDRNTYTSECQMSRSGCLLKKHLQVLHIGSCTDSIAVRMWWVKRIKSVTSRDDVFTEHISDILYSEDD